MHRSLWVRTKYESDPGGKRQMVAESKYTLVAACLGCEWSLTSVSVGMLGTFHRNTCLRILLEIIGVNEDFVQVFIPMGLVSMKVTIDTEMVGMGCTVFLDSDNS